MCRTLVKFCCAHCFCLRKTLEKQREAADRDMSSYGHSFVNALKNICQNLPPVTVPFLGQTRTYRVQRTDNDVVSPSVG